jgi:hypothetical protein
LSQSRFEILISQSVTYGNYFIINLLTPITLLPLQVSKDRVMNNEFEKIWKEAVMAYSSVSQPL